MPIEMNINDYTLLIEQVIVVLNEIWNYFVWDRVGGKGEQMTMACH